MGDNTVNGLTREIMARVESEVQALLEKANAANTTLEARVRDLETELATERATRAKAEEDAEAYRRWGQKLYVQLNPPTEADLEFWRNAKPSDFPVSADEFHALLDQLANEP